MLQGALSSKTPLLFIKKKPTIYSFKPGLVYLPKEFIGKKVVNSGEVFALSLSLNFLEIVRIGPFNLKKN